ncbi:MAG TPA: TonB-dependent receptor [Candidatus Sulfotelmatobacter sp.]|nr:TonB-dependent receptor [Candidatus Sulfotelmatobacter sp.]
MQVPRGLSLKPFLSILASILWLTLATPSWAQKDMGNIVGQVKDTSGAVVADASVTVTDVDRGTTFHTTSNASGDYVAGPLRIGQYTITVEKPGFKKAVAGPVPLNVQDRLPVDVVMQVGTVNETMTVTTITPQLETETSELGNVVSGKTATTLPLNGRNFAQLAQLSVGVAPSEPGSRTETSFGFSSNGARALQNNFLLDGIDNNANLGDVLNGSAYVIQPSVDAIGEFKVETNSYSAEFGRGNGAIMNAVIKSGTNGFHGDLYEFIRNDKLDGRNAFDFFGRQQYQQNQFGATLGGPIIKDRTFFFVDYEGLRIRQALPQLLLIPSPAQVGGNFSSELDLTNPIAGVVDCSGNPTYQGEIFNPRLTQPSAVNPSGFCGVPIGVTGAGVPTNVFPATGPNAINPAAKAIAALYPQPNVNVNGNNYLVDPKKSLDQNNFDVRVDNRFSDRDNFFARFSYENQPIFTPGPFTNYLDGGGFTAGNQDNAYRSAAISELHTFTSTLLNEFRLGYNRINSHRVEPFSNTNVSGQLGLLGVPFSPGIGGLPNICFVNYNCIGASDFLPSVEKQNSFVLNENLIWSHKRHSLKVGTELRYEQFTIFQDSAPRGDMAYGPDFTSNPGEPVDANGNTTGGDDIASFFLGVPDSANIVNLHAPDYRRKTLAFFGQDDIRVSDRLTLNLGLRYELFMPVTEARNQQGTFDFRTDSIVVPKGQNVQLTPTLASYLPLQATASAGLISPDYTNWAPRIGLALKLTDRLVMRSGYGIFYGGVENGPFSFPSPGFNPPYFVTQSFNSPCGNPVPPQANPAYPADLCAIGVKLPTNGGAPDTSLMINNFWTQGYPANSLADPNNPLLYSISPTLKTPMMQQWHLGFQYQFPRETVVELSYAGSQGSRLYGFYNGNQATPSADPNAPLAPRRPFPAVDGTIDSYRSDTISNYNSLQARVQKRAARGLQFEASYTYSHSLDEASSASLGSLNNGDFRDQRYPSLEYGNSDFDVRHHLVVSYSYDLPFGKGQLIGGNASGFANQLIGNWQVAGIVSASTGNWFTVTDPFNNAANNDCGGTVSYNCTRPNVVGNPNAKPCLPGTFFNTCAFASDTTPGTYGNEGRNVAHGPGYQAWDMSVLKAFPVREQMHIEFRGDFFNIWNHVNPLWGPIGAAGQVEPVAIEIGTPQFGQLQAARDPRLIQFALKFYF